MNIKNKYANINISVYYIHTYCLQLSSVAAIFAILVTNAVI